MSMPQYLKKYPHLFQPLIVGQKRIVYKNRIMVGPMQVSGAYSSDTHGVINDYGVDYYTDLARGGFSSCAIPIEVPAHSAHIGTINLDEASKGFTFMHIAQRSIHAFGCRTACEIYHPGICALPSVCPPMGPSSFMYNGQMVHAMTENDMEDVALMYFAAARQAKRSGFDAVMLHYAHGWLMNNFLSPLSNKRTDKYGGSVENRVRFPLMVIKRVREAIGPDMLIEIRMNGSDRTKGGITPEDAAQQALIMEDYVDMIHLSCGTRLDARARPKMHPTCFIEPGHNIDGADALKKAGFKKPVGVIGAVHRAELAEQFIADGRCDYVLMARQAVADPDFVNKIREGREEDIRPCIHCDYCVDGGRRKALTTEVSILDDATFDTQCSVNPLFGQGSARVRAFRFTGKKSVAVVGGGIAGMQAAITASEKGHDVTLFEQQKILGGQASFYPQHLWFKKEVLAFREYLITQVRKSNVKVLLGAPVSPEIIAQSNFDAVIVAIGARQIVPPISGLDKKRVAMAWNVFGNEDKLGKRVAIVGGGVVGCEMSIALGERGHEVTVVEMTPFFAATAEIAERMSLEEHMLVNDVVILAKTRCVEVTDTGIRVHDHDDNEGDIPADSVIIAAGSEPLAIERDRYFGTAFDVIYVGDCIGPANIRNATDTGWCAGNIV